MKGTCYALLLVGLADLAVAADETPRFPAGADSFQTSCAVCHGAKGAGVPALAPPLTTYPAAYATVPDGRRQLSRTVLNGLFGGIDVEHKHYDFKMPEFTQLSDAELAAALNFVVFDLSHAADSVRPLAPEEIAAERAKPVDAAALRAARAKLLATLGL
jgi:mono/diheme cytochrome c family protein